jgi:8-oxo-dGTP pyrophosphatase MutT (NUDIX family)
MLGLSLIVCRNKQGKYLAVNESRNRGWWLPGGRVDPPESFHEAAIRETLEEAGIHVELKGVLRIEYNISEL